MAMSLFPLEQDLSCPVCFEIFNDPVILSCSHSFCRTCLQRSWEEKMERECPVCRCQSSEGHLPTNLALRSACESFLQQKRARDLDPQRCPLHCMRLHLFCERDEKLVCTQCVSQHHQNHSFCSISKAASPRKEKLKILLARLETKRKVFQKSKYISEQVAAHIKSQAQNTETQIQEDFEKLHQFLREEEEATTAALKVEEEKKSQRMKKKIQELDKQIMEIISRVTELNNILKEDILIVQDFKKASERAEYIVPDPQPQESGALIDVAKHLGNLSYRVCKKMKNVCPYFPVVLDPNTANPSLSISADFSSFSNSAENPQLPDNPERMSAYESVLGSEGFSSGTYSWEVEVGNSEDWIVGVAEETVSRKETCGAVPENGFCCIWRDGNNITAGLSLSTSETLMKKPTIKRIRVTLKCQEGLVIFSNSDNNTDLHTFAHKFTKKVYPYFNNGSKNALKVIQQSNTESNSLTQSYSFLSRYFFGTST
ncbi:zinc-binding protein A33-like [Pygocentrus nattereri]|uniref:zinc-binding protein A33-like n=1 Tax=Pygocentrus nattereri TaxID=42514 RepID=UPI001891951A|nr:zinc-binding protein A33-like [Pygocentrus nattereri]